MNQKIDDFPEEERIFKSMSGKAKPQDGSKDECELFAENMISQKYKEEVKTAQIDMDDYDNILMPTRLEKIQSDQDFIKQQAEAMAFINKGQESQSEQV